MIHTSFFCKLALGFFGLSLLWTISACSRARVELSPACIIETQRQTHDRQSLDEAMDSFEKGAYPEAKKQFILLAEKTANKKIKNQAQLGNVLSDIISAGTLDEVKGPEKNFENLMQQSSHEMPVDIRLIRPFIQIKRENIVFQEENRDVHFEIKAARNKIQALEKEKKNLLGQIQELEELFNLIEQKKRRFLLNSQ